MPFFSPPSLQYIARSNPPSRVVGQGSGRGGVPSWKFALDLWDAITLLGPRFTKDEWDVRFEDPSRPGGFRRLVDKLRNTSLDYDYSSHDGVKTLIFHRKTLSKLGEILNAYEDRLPVDTYPKSNPYSFAEPRRSNPDWHPGGGIRIGGRYHPGSGRFRHGDRPSGEYDHGGGRRYRGQWYPGGGHYEANPALPGQWDPSFRRERFDDSHRRISSSLDAISSMELEDRSAEERRDRALRLPPRAPGPHGMVRRNPLLAVVGNPGPVERNACYGIHFHQDKPFTAPDGLFEAAHGFPPPGVEENPAKHFTKKRFVEGKAGPRMVERPWESGTLSRSLETSPQHSSRLIGILKSVAKREFGTKMTDAQAKKIVGLSRQELSKSGRKKLAKIKARADAIFYAQTRSLGLLPGTEIPDSDRAEPARKVTKKKAGKKVAKKKAVKKKATKRRVAGNPGERCSATKKDGKRCQGTCYKNLDVCVFHRGR